jgi:hypothetical protein
MKTAIFYHLNPSVLDSLRMSFREAGYTVTSVQAAEALLQAVGQEQPSLALCELSKVSFASLLRTLVTLRPDMPIYVMEAGTVFCRYPMRGWHSDVADALRSGGVNLSPHLTIPEPGTGEHQTDATVLI